MQAVIFAAGKGMRMRPLTNTTPKPLLKVGKASILAHNLRQLAGLVEEVVIVVGYKGEMIKDAIGDSFEGLPVTYVWQEEQVGTGDAARLTAPHLKGICLFLNGDDLYDKKDLELLLSSAPAVMAAEVKDPKRFGVFTVQGDVAVDLVEKPEDPQSNVVNVGAYALPSSILSTPLTASARGEYEFTDYVKAYLTEHPLRVSIAERWFPIADPDSLKEAEKFLQRESS